MLRFIWRLSFFGLGLGLLLSPIWLTLLLIEKAPRVTNDPTVNIASVGRAERLLRELDPRRLRQGQLKSVTFKENDFNLALAHLLSRPEVTQRLQTEVDFSPAGADVQATFILPANPVGQFLNLSFAIVPVPDGAGLSALRLGRIAIPDWCLNKILGLLNESAQNDDRYRDLVAATAAIETLTLTDRSASLSFRWDQQLAARLGEHGRNLLLPAPERDRLLAYRQQINERLNGHAKSSLSLLELLKPTFALAAIRATDNTSAAAENRAALLALALIAVGRPQAWNHLLGDEVANAMPSVKRRVRLTLQGRDDLPKHFLISAALVGAADTAVADVIGVYKEVQDSAGGSGFSFVDLAADRAGVRLAEKAARAPRELTQLIARATNESELFPASRDLAEGMQAKDFKRRYQDPSSAEYRKVVASIEKRLDRLALYR